MTPAAVVSSSTSSIAVAGHAFGDTVKHAVRVLSFDRETEQANVFVAQPENVLVLAVVPGRDVEVIFPGIMTVKRSKAENTFAFDMRWYQVQPGARRTPSQARESQAYQYCMAERGAGRRPAGNSLTKASTASENSLQACAEHLSPDARRQTKKAMPPRAPRDRYLVVLSSSSAMAPVELEIRLATLTTVAPDVALTIEALAAGIYAGLPGTWGGTYVSW